MSKWQLHASSSGTGTATATATGGVAVPPPSSADTENQFRNGEYPKRSGLGLGPGPAAALFPHTSDDAAGAQNPGPEMLTPGRLLSSRCCVASGLFLDGASTSTAARVGLDIGGTLCKVVYFEPDIGVDFPVSSVDESDLKHNKVLEQQNHRHHHPQEEESYSSSAKGSNGLGKEEEEAGGGDAQGSAESTSKVVSSGEEGRRGHHSEQETERNSPGSDYRNERGNSWATATATGGVVSESCQCSCGPSGGVQGSDLKNENRRRMFPAGVESEQKARTQAQEKIWVSSHEPVYLSGRGTLYFKCFETWQMEEFLNLTKEYHLMTAGQAIGATGGGARKFSDRFLEIAGLNLQRADELKSLVRGIDFLVRNAHHENFEYPSGPYQGGSIQRPLTSPEDQDSPDEGSSDNVCSKDEISANLWKASLSESSVPISLSNGQPESGQPACRDQVAKLGGAKLTRLDSGVWTGRNEPLYPYLVVNIGSGVSILRVESPDKFERVGGTSLGGSTFLGLAKALTGCQSFEEALSLAGQGDSTNVDMLVGDIYGGDYSEMGLAATTVASSFGKLVQPRQNLKAQQPENLAKAALLMVTNNIGSIAWLHARDVHSVMFTGSFLHNNKLAMRLLAVAMEFWSKGKMKAVFLRHEGHAGAMGALLSSLDTSNPLDALLLS